jgi:hypothetical protein
MVNLKLYDWGELDADTNLEGLSVLGFIFVLIWSFCFVLFYFCVCKYTQTY